MKLNVFASTCLFGLAVGVSVVTGCAGDRPLRNGVPNEQLFLRKSFIIRPGTGATPTEQEANDAGWFLKGTVYKTSTPNPLAQSVLFNGAENAGIHVRFVATQDSLQLMNLREISGLAEIKAEDTRTPEVINAWQARHVDLKLAVTPDGEKTNRFEENQELDWKVRQWVQVNLARNDLGDFAMFGSQEAFRLKKCVAGGSMTTVVPGSVVVDEAHDYLEWKVSVTLPIVTDDESCMESYGEPGKNFVRLGRSNVTAWIKYSMVRAKPLNDVTYEAMEIPEKDPIKRKYGPILQTSYARDNQTGQIAARQFAQRFDRNKDIVLYFAKGYPEDKKGYFRAKGGIVDQTNEVLERAGAKARLVVKNYDEDIPDDAHPSMKELDEDGRIRGREYGDIRFNFIRWMSDLDSGAPFIGVAQSVPDPRTGENVSASINIADFPLREYVAMRVDAFLETIMCRAATGIDEETRLPVCQNLLDDKPWGPPVVEKKDGSGKVVYEVLPDSCTAGDIVPLLPSRLADTYGKSSLFSKMQEYLGESVQENGHLGPRDFVPNQSADFERAFFKILPYYIFADPKTNPFVSPVGDGGEFNTGEQFKALEKVVEFNKLTAMIDRGETGFEPTGGVAEVEKAAGLMDNLRQGQLALADYNYKKLRMHKAQRKLDTASDLVSFTGVMERAGRRCVEGHWETREEWIQKLIDSYHALTVWHELGHFMGMDHNFMGSVDKPNYPHYRGPKGEDRVGMYSSTVMDYSATPDRIFWANESGAPGWAPYDRAAIAWLYGNEGTLSSEQRATASSEASARPPEGVSGQLSPTMPWNDPLGFDATGKEVQFLYCNADHIKYTPFCRQQDFGSTPSEIIANEMEAYEWQYAWRNFRKYRKTWDLHDYAKGPAQELLELRRFLPMWAQDWTDKTLRDDFGRYNVERPPGAPSNELYYTQLATAFDDEMSQTNQMVAAFYLAIIQQSAGERPYVTIINKFNGDVEQQGITLDKTFAMQNWIGTWPSLNYDPNQTGTFISSFGTQFDQEYNAVAQDAALSMIGGKQFDSFPGLKFGAVALFAKDTHSTTFTGEEKMKDWVGGLVFNREDELLNYFRTRAVKAQKFPELGCAKRTPSTVPDHLVNGVKLTDDPTTETCKYDPRVARTSDAQRWYSDKFNEFTAPDQQGPHDWAWVYIKDRNQWVFVDKNRNIASYKIVRDYNTQVTFPNEETDAAFQYRKQVVWYLDAYRKYEGANAN